MAEDTAQNTGEDTTPFMVSTGGSSSLGRTVFTNENVSGGDEITYELQVTLSDVRLSWLKRLLHWAAYWLERFCSWWEGGARP